MHLLQAGVNITVIQIWLGHENPTTTHQCVEADLKMMQRALQSLQPPKTVPARYRPKDESLRFLLEL
jgi:integrase/recombinase XerD